MRYNRKEIMKRAWELFRKLATTRTFGECLKQSWAEAKDPDQTERTARRAAREARRAARDASFIEDLKRSIARGDKSFPWAAGMYHFFTWINGAEKRIYIEPGVLGRTRGSSYIDAVTGENHTSYHSHSPIGGDKPFPDEVVRLITEACKPQLAACS